MNDLYLAYYQGTGNWQDRLIRWATRSRFSHVEMVVLEAGANPQEQAFSALSWSASARDGGVRSKEILFKPGNWKFQKVQHWFWPKYFASAKFHEGAKYDYKGLLLSQVFALNRHSRQRWFCSEFCAYALGLPHPQRFSPAGLFDAVSQLNWAFLEGRSREADLRNTP